MALSNEEAKRQRKQLDREIVAEHRRKAREKLQALRSNIRNVKARRKQAMCRVREGCRRGRRLAKDRARARAKQIREAARIAIANARREEIERARAACKARKQTVKGAALSATARRRELLRAEREFQAEMRRIESWSKKRKRLQLRTTAKEARQESDDEVRSNIPPELRELFEQVKRSIRGSTRQSRTEEFLRYAEAHPDEVIASQQDLADQEIARLLREERRLSRAVRKTRPPTPEELAAIPF